MDLSHVEHGDEAGMSAEPPHGLRLAVEARACDVVEALRLDQRDGDVAVEAGVVRELDAFAPTLRL